MQRSQIKRRPLADTGGTQYNNPTQHNQRRNLAMPGKLLALL
ncbi:hypothetical protein [Vreelandella profundi]|nr:hypothetical protein [Halomonas profundi]